MRDAHILAEIGKMVARRAMRDLGDRHMNIRLAKPIDDGRAGESGPRFPPDRIRNSSQHERVIQSHLMANGPVGGDFIEGANRGARKLAGQPEAE